MNNDITNKSTGRNKRFRKRFRRIEINLNPAFAAVWNALGRTKNLNNSAVAELLLLRFAEQAMDTK